MALTRLNSQRTVLLRNGRPHNVAKRFPLLMLSSARARSVGAAHVWQQWRVASALQEPDSHAVAYVSNHRSLKGNV
jgi:hypothetical protein